ncbi:tigger transposable element-derived protein 6-like [Rhizophagus clarus]|uniref:Tigger transposable element-derived protein 6-like n=1 Tax=Rhizophagus clarus TaxID=94130 RepID=A0A8H3KZQ0_9GLOM|nr:tigger transposable element-derived protein 6-like [Rhizophagus clarus]
MPPIRSQKVKQTQQTRTAISVDIKKEICEFILANPDRKQGDIASFFNKKYTDLNIQRTTINKIWKNKEKWLSVLSTSQSSPTGLPLSDMILQQKGLEFAKMFNVEDKLKCFKNFNKSAFPVTYRANSKAWIRSDIFLKWLNHFDYYFRTLNQKILLFINNVSSHFNPKRFEKNNDEISILPSGNIKDVDDVNNNGDNINSDLSKLERLLDELPEDSDNLLEYFQMLDKEISIEEILTDKQIINFIKHDETKKAVDSLKIFINYFKQQVDDDFNINDL